MALSLCCPSGGQGPGVDKRQKPSNLCGLGPCVRFRMGSQFTSRGRHLEAVISPPPPTNSLTTTIERQHLKLTELECNDSTEWNAKHSYFRSQNKTNKQTEKKRSLQAGKDLDPELRSSDPQDPHSPLPPPVPSLPSVLPRNHLFQTSGGSTHG